MPAPSIIRSFWEHLPVLPYTLLSDGSNYRKIHSTAASTVETDPPVAWIPEHYTVLINLAQNPNRLPPNPPSHSRLRERIPQIESTHLIHTEADVLRATHLYLLHPVNVAATLLMPQGGSLYCRSEVQDSSSRTDIRWI